MCVRFVPFGDKSVFYEIVERVSAVDDERGRARPVAESRPAKRERSGVLKYVLDSVLHRG